MRRWMNAGLSWLVDHAIEHWPTIVAAVIGGGLMTYLAAVSQWLEPFGPVAWGAAGLLALLIMAIALALLGIARTKFVAANFAEKFNNVTSVNPMAGRYERQRVRLADFFHPFYRPIEDARFENCDLLGPAHLVFVGNTIIGNSSFYDCEIVIVKPNAVVRGVTGFKDCHINRCRLFRLTLYMPKDAFLKTKAQMGGNELTVISDGTAGLL
ncbi:MAG TPA: hypothetical protein VJT81_06465 [Burkholderiales bacterium]|nr:hypothetical protein [Burkholderiales bacterium]